MNLCELPFQILALADAGAPIGVSRELLWRALRRAHGKHLTRANVDAAVAALDAVDAVTERERLIKARIKEKP